MPLSIPAPLEFPVQWFCSVWETRLRINDQNSEQAGWVAKSKQITLTLSCFTFSFLVYKRVSLVALQRIFRIREMLNWSTSPSHACFHFHFWSAHVSSHLLHWTSYEILVEWYHIYQSFPMVPSATACATLNFNVFIFIQTYREERHNYVPVMVKSLRNSKTKACPTLQSSPSQRGLLM